MTERDLKKLWPKNEWNSRHLQIIFFGREYCPARGHNLNTCLICSWASSKKRKSDDKEQHHAMRFKMVKEIQNPNKRMDLAMKMDLESKKFDIMTLIKTNTNASEGIKKVWNKRMDEIQKQIDEINEKLQMDNVE